MERIIFSKLVKWKNKPIRKPLVLLGARQVGKTFILREFGRREFKHTIYINCYADSFAIDLFRTPDAKRIVKEIERKHESKITPGDTLLIFDEIQEVDNGIASLKFFCEDYPDLHVAVAGSLLGISLHEGESFPVGKIETLRMYPMSFSEYLCARGRVQLNQCVQDLDWDSMSIHHESLVDYLREYYFVGGMPEAVQEFVNTQDTHQVRNIQSEIINAYFLDMGKHSKTQTQRIHMVWKSIPSQLARENKKFIFGALKKGARAADFEIALQWLLDAGLIYNVERLRTMGSPLSFYADAAAFKVFLLDCGLLSCLCNTPAKDILVGNSVFAEYKGAFTENFVLQQMMVALDCQDIYYFSKDNSTQEVDFLVQTENRIIPIEVKSEENVRSKSFSSFVRNDHATLNLKGLRISMKPYSDQQWMENIPLYATESFFKKELE